MKKYVKKYRHHLSSLSLAIAVIISSTIITVHGFYYGSTAASAVTDLSCPSPYHVLTSDNRCVWSCSEGTTPDNATNECVCKSGYTETSKDQFNRRVCTLPVDNSCIDSDGGYKPETFGNVQWTDAAGTRKTTNDICIGSSVMEAVCDSSGYANNSQTYECAHGCSNGACINASCIDSDGGYKPETFGNVQWTDRTGTRKTTNDICIGSTVMEAVCDSSGWANNSQTYTCPHGCANGTCITTPCTDSDGGYKPETFGTVEWTDRTGTRIKTNDLCIGATVMEAVCDSSGYANNSQTYTCPNGCANGVCIATSTAAISVLYPNGGISFPQTGSLRASAKVTSSKSGNISWYLIRTNNVFERFITSTSFTPTSAANTAYATIPFATDLPVGSDYKLKVVWKSTDGQEEKNDTSDTTFSVTLLAPTKVLSPNGGETWAIGTTQKVTWTTQSGVSVLVDLYKGDKYIKRLSTDAGYGGYAGTSPLSFTVTSELVPGNDYKIKIQTPTLSIYDWSDAAFTISSSDIIACTDDDGGKDYYKRGFATGLYGSNLEKNVIWGEGDGNKVTSRFDFTMDRSKYYDHCFDSATSNQLNEAYCDENGVLQAIGFTCPNGCLNGACIEAVATSTKPDLIVTDLKIDRMASWDPETLKYISASFKNLGGAVDGKQNVKIKITDSASNEVYSNYMVFDNNLTNGYSGTLIMSMPVKNLYSTHNLKAEIDSDNTIVESNENNNTLEKIIQVVSTTDIVCQSLPCTFDGKAINNSWSTVDTSPDYISAKYPYQIQLDGDYNVKMKLRSVVWPNTPGTINTMYVEIDNYVIYKESSTVYNEKSEPKVISLGNLSKGIHSIKIYASPDKNHFMFDWFELTGEKISDSAIISNIEENANRLHENKIDDILAELKELRNLVREQNAKIKYLENLTKDMQKLSEKVEAAINNFITYGVDDNTKKLGEGERAAVIYSYKAAFDKLPETEEELSDAIKIANGRFPSITNDEAEAKAKEQFVKIYKRVADMNNANDNAAIKVMAYGLRQKAENRNLNSEKSGINSFKGIYGHTPKSTEEWNTMQAITYSGAKRMPDADKDLLSDEMEKKLGTDMNKVDTDGDGVKDGEEVNNGTDPLKR